MAKPHSYLDVIGQWSEVKLEILEKYASAYSTILTKNKLRHSYIDGFAGAGQHISKATSEVIPGSPLRALSVQPPFDRYYLIDLDEERVGGLKQLVGDRKNVEVFQGDCNEILLSKVFPQVRYDQYRRGLCILDPYGLHLDWKVIAEAGAMKSIDLFLNFPVMDMNMNALPQDPASADPGQVARMTRFWGDDSWRKAMYTTKTTLFGTPEKESNEILVDEFRKRLKKVGNFSRVPEPMPMRNSKGAVVYYLFFAAQVDVAENIVKDIFKKHG
jgi:three-Cys-motif partner protein